MNRHSRRGFLRAALGPCWTGATLLEQAVFRACHARAQAASAPAGLFDVEKVADGVYAAVARPAAAINCNAVIFENSSDLLVVDTHSKDSAVASLVGQIRKEIPKKPVRYVVNSHFHWDHVQGNGAYRRLFPGADFLSSATTRNLIAELAAKRFRDSLGELARETESLKQQLATAKTAQEKAGYQRRIDGLRAYTTEMRNFTPELPNITFRDRLVIHDKAHELHLAFCGRGHTAGDIIVYCPQKKVIATGDLLHGFLPYIGDGYPLEWPATLKAVAEFDFLQAIGGHGAVQHTRDRLAQMSSYIHELAEAVSRGKRAGRTAAQLQAAITPASLKSLGGGYGSFVAASLKKYTIENELIPPDTVLADGVKENVASTFKALENR